ncbi:hypothetical protein C357_08171 [Citreicella sp. 357]|nr:hypothetical protein C357_08171 [Citreicella sp. 357]
MDAGGQLIGDEFVNFAGQSMHPAAAWLDDRGR